MKSLGDLGDFLIAANRRLLHLERVALRRLHMSIGLPMELVHLDRWHLDVAHPSVSGGRARELSMITRLHIVG